MSLSQWEDNHFDVVLAFLTAPVIVDNSGCFASKHGGFTVYLFSDRLQDL
jgi:hypothetical protein